MPVLLNELSKAFRFFDRVEVFTLNVLDQRDLGRGRIVELANDGGDRVKPCPLCRAPAALTGDDLEALAVRSQQDRLQYSTLGNGIGEFLDRLFLELNARLLWIGADSPDLDFPHAAGARWCTLSPWGRWYHLLA